jgi:hypothetical protein
MASLKSVKHLTKPPNKNVATHSKRPLMTCAIYFLPFLFRPTKTFQTSPYFQELCLRGVLPKQGVRGLIRALANYSFYGAVTISFDS